MALLAWLPTASLAAGAGITLYRVAADGRVHLLLADHQVFPERGWAGFGGRLDGQAPADAAAREAYEESRGLVSEHYLRASIDRLEPAVTGSFSAWFVETDWPGLAAALNRLPPPNASAVFEERGPYAWIPLEAVVAAMDNPDADGRMRLPAGLLPAGARTRHLFVYYADSLRRALQLGLLPGVRRDSGDL